MRKNITIEIEEVKDNAVALLRHKADRARQQGDLARAQRFTESADYLELRRQPSWAHRSSGRKG